MYWRPSEFHRAWIECRRPGDLVDLVDTRGSHRQFRVIETAADRCRVEVWDTTYLDTGTVMSCADDPTQRRRARSRAAIPPAVGWGSRRALNFPHDIRNAFAPTGRTSDRHSQRRLESGQYSHVGALEPGRAKHTAEVDREPRVRPTPSRFALVAVAVTACIFMLSSCSSKNASSPTATTASSRPTPTSRATSTTAAGPTTLEADACGALRDLVDEFNAPLDPLFPDGQDAPPSSSAVILRQRLETFLSAANRTASVSADAERLRAGYQKLNDDYRTQTAQGPISNPEALSFSNEFGESLYKATGSCKRLGLPPAPIDRFCSPEAGGCDGWPSSGYIHWGDPIPAAPATTAPPPTPIMPCGGVASVSTAVVNSPIAGMNTQPIEYDVRNVTISSADAAWVRFDFVAKPGITDYQGGYGVAHCVANSWIVVDVGTDMVGCPGGSIAAPTPAVRSSLNLGC